MPSQIDLEQELRELGRTLVVAPPPDDLAERVVVRVRTEGPRRGRLSTWWHWLTGSRRRLVAAIVAAVLIGLVLTPPVRAAVVEWLHIGGVLIKSAPPPAAPSVSPEPVPTSGPAVSLDRAQAMVDFSLGVPENSARRTTSVCRLTGVWCRWSGAVGEIRFIWTSSMERSPGSS
jgi:hypothetical protein